MSREEKPTRGQRQRVGYFTRLIVPRRVRRGVHPVRSAKRVVRKVVVPKSVRRAMYAAKQIANPISAVKYHAIERPIATALRGASRSRKESAPPVFLHEGCSVRHRSAEAASKCRTGRSARSRSSITASLVAAPVSAPTQTRTAVAGWY